MDALEQRDDSNGQISAAKIKELLESFQSKILSGVKTIHNSGLLGCSEKEKEVILDPIEGEIPTFCNGKYVAFCYAEAGSTDQKFWQVPHDFKFPKVNQLTG